MALNSRILAAKSQFFGVMGISNADKEFVVKVRSTCSHLPKGTVKEHAVGILGGIIWSIGMSFSILASGPAGYAISYGLGQGATMIAVIWGVFVWREFASAPAGTNKLINAMFAFYILGIALIIAANSI